MRDKAVKHSVEPHIFSIQMKITSPLQMILKQKGTAPRCTNNWAQENGVFPSAQNSITTLILKDDSKSC